MTVSMRIFDAIIGGSRFASLLTREDSKGPRVFPTITGVTGQAWVNEDKTCPTW